MFQRVVPCFFLVLAAACGGAIERDDGSGNSTSGTTTPSDPPACSCLRVDCPDGQLVTGPDGCCPICSCEGIECADPICPSGQTGTPPGHCCPQCVDLLCSGVVCSSPAECESGRSYFRPDGACCPDCIPNEPVACNEIACPDDTCPKGYVRGDLMGGCCSECLPDPLYCEATADCVLADRPRPCCGCPEVISKRTLDDDACWSPVLEPRTVAEACYPDATCDAVCGACPEPGSAACVNNRCVERLLE